MSANILQLPASMRLKGEENYPFWKEQMTILIQSLGLFNYIDSLYAIPTKVDLNDFKISQDDRDRWTTYRNEDAKARLAITYNIDNEIQRLIIGKETAISMWTAL